MTLEITMNLRSASDQKDETARLGMLRLRRPMVSSVSSITSPLGIERRTPRIRPANFSTMDSQRSVGKLPFVTSSVLLSLLVTNPQFKAPNPVYGKDR